MKKYVALCGAPGAGKSEVQKYLHEKHGVMPVDDGYPCREIAITHFGLGHDDVYTQAGKNRSTVLPGGRSVVNRVLLGEIGNKLEEIGGPDFIPCAALLRIENVDNWAFSFGSVRRNQGRIYKAYGGIVIEIERPGFFVENEFDRYDRSCIDLTITNGGDLGTLRRDVDRFVADYLTR